MQILITRLLKLGFLLYYIVSISFRLSFVPRFGIFNGIPLALFFDYLADMFFMMDYLAKLTRHNVVTPTEMAVGALNTMKLHSVPGKRQRIFKKSAVSPMHQTEISSSRIDMLYQVLMLFPLEVVGFLAGFENYYALRALRLLRCVYFNQYWREFAEVLDKYRIATTAGTQRIILLALMMALVAHVFACLFYAVALSALEHGSPNNWIYFDELATLNEDNGEIIYHHPLSFRYLRAIYWSIQTVTSITFGDIVAHSQSETWFCVFYFLVTAAIVCVSVANLTMVITNFDSARTENLMKIIKFEKYAAYRQLPPALTNRVVSYYKHQWERLRGVDEQKIMAELPSNVAEQVLHQVVRDRLVLVSTLKDLNKGCLNALAERVESYVYSPTDAIIEEESQVTGVFIIAEGVVSCTLLNSSQGIELNEGQVFGEKALRCNYISVYKFTAKTFCEVLVLRGSAFRHLCQMYLTSTEIDELIDKIALLDSDRAITEKWGQDKEKSDSAAHHTALRKPPSILVRSGKLTSHTLTKTSTPPMSIASLFRHSSSSVLTGAASIGTQLNPGSHFRLWWGCVLLCGLCFYSISCGLLIQATLRRHFMIHYTPLLIASYAMDLIFFVDMVLAASLFAFNDKGIVITDTKKIFNKFLQERAIISIFSIFPYDVVFGYSLDYRLIPLLRLLKLLHLHQFEIYIANFEDVLLRYANIAASFEMRRFLTLYLFLFQLCHWAACAWQLVADVSIKVFDYRDSWRNADMHSEFFSVNYAALSGTASYWRALYWAVNVMSSIGVSDILAKNSVEMVTVVFIMFFGYLMFNTLIGAIASLMESFNRDKHEFNSKVDKIRQLVKYKSVSKQIETKIVRYYEYIWARYGGVDEADVLGNLPKSLRAAVTDFVLGPLLQKIPFFEQCSEPMEQMLVVLFETRIFLEDDALMHAGEMGKEMFIIERGEVQVCPPDRSITFATLKVGDYIGESCFIEPTKRTASVFAIGYVDTYFLTRENFLKAAEKFPSEYGDILEAIEETLLEKAEKNENLKIANSPEKLLEKKNSESAMKIAATAAAAPKIADSTSAATAANSRAPSDHRRTTLFHLRSDLKDQVDKTEEEGRAVASVGNIHPDSAVKLYWDVMICFTLLYYAMVIPLRIALRLDPALLIVDYVFDFLNLVDNYLYVAVFAIYAGGKLLVYDEYIRAHYMKQRFIYDFLASIPYDFIALGFVDMDFEHMLMIRALLRLPKLVRLGLFMHYYAQLKHFMKLMNASSLFIHICELFGSLILMSHWVACGFYLFSIYGQKIGDCSDEDFAMYGNGCHFRGTWVEQQIVTLKLPKGGGNQWTRFLTAFNWAITTSVGVSIGDVWVMNINEVVFAFFVMFCGLAVNGMIIGSVMTLVTDASEEGTRIYRNMEVLQAYLIDNHVPLDLVQRASAHLRHLATTEGSLTNSQDAIFAELPHSIKLAVDSQLKTGPFLRQCPIFDFCSQEVLRGISAKLQVQFNVKGDKIITGGELGHEMFFVESGSVNVISLDGQIVYSTLEEGSFFGETALFFRSVRSATVVVASPFSVCLRLSKVDLEHELRSADFDPEEVIKTFTALQKSNERRNKAVTSNLALAKDPKSKLFKLTGAANEGTKASRLHKLRLYLAPDSYARMTWDILGLVFLLYYAMTIPFYIGFLGQTMDEYYQYCVVDFAIDSYWVADILLKAFVFSYRPDLVHDNIIADGTSIWNHYMSSGFVALDVFASIPLEFFALVPGTADVLLFTLRSNHLVRILQLSKYANLAEQHMQVKLKVVLGRASALLLRAACVYLLFTHWFSCVYFMIHRYAERNFSLTYVIADHMSTYNQETGRHDVCSYNIAFCYARSLYYVLGTLTGTGYGDIAPYTNLEYFAQMVIAIVGAFIAAAFLGFCGNFLADRDAKGDNAFNAKMQQLELYIKIKNLTPQTRLAILAHYTHMWRKVKSTRGEKNEILSLLSHSSAMDLSLHLQSTIMEAVPIFRTLPYHTRRRLALALQPQNVVADTYLYKAGDVGQCMYFVAHGSVRVELQTDRSALDSRGLTAMQILLHKQEAHGDIYVSGDHFGEFCVVSSSGLRADTVKVVLPGTEVYSLSQTDLWDMFQFLTQPERRSFIYELMTRVGERHHITKKQDPAEPEEGQKLDDGRIKHLHRLAFEVMTEIVDDLEDNEAQKGESKLDETDKNFAMRKIIRENTSYAAFTQKDLIDLFVGQASEDSFHLSFSAQAMQSRLERMNTAKPSLRSLLQLGKKGKASGLAGLVKQVIGKPAADTHSGTESPGAGNRERTKSDEEVQHRRQVHLTKSPLLFNISKNMMKTGKVKFQSENNESGVELTPSGGAAVDTEEPPTNRGNIDEIISDTPEQGASKPLAKALRMFLKNKQATASPPIAGARKHLERALSGDPPPEGYPLELEPDFLGTIPEDQLAGLAETKSPYAQSSDSYSFPPDIYLDSPVCTPRSESTPDQRDTRFVEEIRAPSLSDLLSQGSTIFTSVRLPPLEMKPADSKRAESKRAGSKQLDHKQSKAAPVDAELIAESKPLTKMLVAEEKKKSTPRRHSSFDAQYKIVPLERSEALVPIEPTAALAPCPVAPDQLVLHPAALTATHQHAAVTEIIADSALPPRSRRVTETLLERRNLDSDAKVIRNAVTIDLSLSGHNKNRRRSVV